MQLSPRWHARHRSGEVVSRITSDVGRVLDAVVAMTAKLVPNVLSVIGVLIILLLIHPWLAVLGLAVVPVLALAAIRQRTLVHGSQTAARAAAGPAVRRHQRPGAQRRRRPGFRPAGCRARRLRPAKRRGHCDGRAGRSQVEAGWSPRSDIVLAVGSGLVLVAGGLQVRSGALTAGLLLVVISYLKDLYAPIRSLTRLSAVLAKARASIERVCDVFDADEMIIDDPGAPVVRSGPLAIEFSGVGFGYDPAQPVLDDLDLEIAPGETLCLLGPSGVGKSTLLLLVLRLYDIGLRLDRPGRARPPRPTGCRVCVARWRTSPRTRGCWTRRWPRTSRSATDRASRADVIAACGAAHVDEFVDRLPIGYDTKLGEGAGRLSGGQRRRVALARAGVSRGRNPVAGRADRLVGRCRRRGGDQRDRRDRSDSDHLIVTHDPRLAALADRTVILGTTDRGRRARLDRRREVNTMQTTTIRLQAPVAHKSRSRSRAGHGRSRSVKIDELPPALIPADPRHEGELHEDPQHPERDQPSVPFASRSRSRSRTGSRLIAGAPPARSGGGAQERSVRPLHRT